MYKYLLIKVNKMFLFITILTFLQIYLIIIVPSFLLSYNSHKKPGKLMKPIYITKMFFVQNMKNGCGET